VAGILTKMLQTLPESDTSALSFVSIDANRPMLFDHHPLLDGFANDRLLGSGDSPNTEFIVRQFLSKQVKTCNPA
jgi:hypothetical protein